MVLCCFLAMHTGAATIRVPGDQPTIQAGIDMAVDGDIVLVADGTYRGPGNKNITFHGYAITVRSEHGRDACIIDCELNGRGFYFTSTETEDAMLEGFSIINGLTTGGSAVFCFQSSPSIVDCVMLDNYAGGEPDRGDGGAIYCMSASPVISGCLIDSNRAEYNGGGIYLTNGSHARIVNCIITNNSTVRFGTNCGGGGILCDEDSRAELINCLIAANQCGDGLGGGVFCLRSDAEILNCTVTANFGTGGGGIRVVDSFPVITNTIVWNNLHEELYDPGMDALITYSDVRGGYPGEGNMDADPLFTNGPHGSFYLSQVQSGQSQTSSCMDAGREIASGTCFDTPQQRMCITDLTTRTDHEPDAGQTDIGFHYLHPEPPEVPPDIIRVPDDCESIQSAINIASDGHVIEVADGTYRGEGNKNLDFNGKAVTVRSENGAGTCFIDCESAGRGVYFHRSETGTSVFAGFTIQNGWAFEGAGIHCDQSSPVIDRCVLEGGTAGTGGGISCRFSSAVISNCRIRQNTVQATGDSVFGGGFFCMRSSPELINCRIEDNTAVGETGANAHGAGISCNQKSDLLLINCLITGNSAQAHPPAETGEAGGIQCTNSTLNIESCTISDNTADRTGGIQHFESNVTLIDTIVWNNLPEDINKPLSATYSDIYGITGTGNFYADPLFVAGIPGDYCLSQTATGHTIDSPCLNAGSTTGDQVCVEEMRGKYCMNLFVTRIDQQRDRSVLNIGFHYPSRFECSSLGVWIDMPSLNYGPKDEFYLDVYACNPMPFHYENLCLFLILDVYGIYFFAPSFTDFDTYIIDLYLGMQVIEVIPPFSWPEGAGSAQGILLYAAMTDADITHLIGDLDMVSFGWYN